MTITRTDTQENGDSPLANARAKALAYHEAVSRHTPLRYSVFSCDSGLYIDGLTKEDQPGVHVRRVRGTNLTDGEMVDYYSSIARSLGGKARARYLNAIYLITPTGEIHESMEDHIASEEFWLVSESHPNQESGFPLDSLSVEITSGEYYKDLKVKPRSQSQEGFQEFFRMVFGLDSVKSASAEATQEITFRA